MALDTDAPPTLQSFAPPKKMTYEEFLEWADEDTYAEWVQGEVLFMSPASDRHQDLAGFLTALLRHFVEAHQSGIVRPAPFQMKTAAHLNGREPDVLFLAAEHLSRMQATYLDGPADLVIEIVSPESAARDRGDKFYEYEQGGVPEYWLIDPVRQQADFFQRDERGIYRPAVLGPDSRYHSRTLPGLWIDVTWLWQPTLPSLLSVLQAWKLV